MIFFETANQARVFLLLLAAGMGAGLLYDLASPLRRRARPFPAALLDAVWCLLSGMLCALALAAGGESTLRLFALLGLLCGGGIYCLGVRRVLRGMIGLLSAKGRKRGAARSRS